MVKAYEQLKLELSTELERILQYWTNNTLDLAYDGFVGKIDHYNNVVANSSKGIILNTRILWSFSAASNHLQRDTYKKVCDRAYHYLKTYFKDQTHKGVFWELDYRGTPVNRRKQVYAQAFAIYALSEYYVFSKNEEAKVWAVEIFEMIETVAKDNLKKGYLEAFNEDWTTIYDMRLSPKDMNAEKTMNTHLHILEAYTRLSDIYENDTLKNSLRDLILLFQRTFLNQKSHYDLFFNTEWKLLSNTVSYGHNIETTWLMIEAAKRLKDPKLLREVERTAIKVANKFLEEAMDENHGVINEKDSNTGLLDTDRHWWPQVEALIGLRYAYELTNDTKYITSSLLIWEFTKEHLLDYKNGEWHFRVDTYGRTYTGEDKVSMWKAPYHTTRCCILLNTV